MIPQHIVDQVREATDIVQIIGEYIRLRRRGRSYDAVCPFHTEKTPSFKVSQDKQIFHCFGCGKGGNVFSFLMEHEKLTFIESVRLLANKAGIIIPQEKSEPKRELLERINFANQLAVEYFRSNLIGSGAQTVYRGYLQDKRKLSPEIIEEFALGFAGEDSAGLINYCRKKDLTAPDLVAAGLAVFSESRKEHFDRFRLRLMIPIFSLSGKPIAFGGRALRKDEPAKYINSPETLLYNKSAVLYGLNFARDHIREQGYVLIVEGYFDFISCWQAGVRNVVASSGTAFTPQQARLLARFTDAAYLFFDSDSAGEAAALRSVDSLFDAGLDVRVMPAQSGMDPDLIARSGGEQLIRQLASQAITYIPYRIRTSNLAHGGIIVKEKLLKELKSLGNKISDPTRRVLFFQEAADGLGVNQEMFTERKTNKASQVSPSVQTARLHKVEEEFLSLLLSNPAYSKIAFESVSPEDFDSKQFGRLYATFANQFNDSGLLDINRLLQMFQDEESISMLTALATVNWRAESLDLEMRQRTQDFLQRKQRRIVAAMKKELAAAEAAGDHKRAEMIGEEMKQYGLRSATKHQN